jgi:hypothetical protein
VAQHDDEIDAGPELAELRADGLHDVDRNQAPADMGFVPLGDLRRRDANHANLKLVAVPSSSTNPRSITIEGGNQGEPSLLRTLQQTTGKRACA